MYHFCFLDTYLYRCLLLFIYLYTYVLNFLVTEMFCFRTQNKKHREHISLIRLPANVLHDPQHYLAPGDEVFVQCKTLSVCFFHSGIYAGDGMAYHFTTDCEFLFSWVCSKQKCAWVELIAFPHLIKK